MRDAGERGTATEGDRGEEGLSQCMLAKLAVEAAEEDGEMESSEE